MAVLDHREDDSAAAADNSFLSEPIHNQCLVWSNFSVKTGHKAHEQQKPQNA